MSPKRVFESLTDEQLSEMALSLISHTITRDDFWRLCAWLKQGIEMTDNPPDPTIDLLLGIGGSVTHTQRCLLQVAMFKWMGVVQTFVLDQQNNMHEVGKNPRQPELFSCL